MAEYHCVHCGKLNVVKRQRKPKEEKKETNPEVPKVIKYYSEAFYSTFNSYPEINWGLCGTIAKALLRDYGYEQTCKYIDEYINTQDKWLKERGLQFYNIRKYIQKKAVIQKSTWNGMM